MARLERVTVFAPATVSNVGSGFDIMGFAIEGVGDLVRMELLKGDSIEIVNESGEDIPCRPDSNVAGPVIESLRRSLKTSSGIKITFLKKIRPGSGIGSSAASASAVAFGYNYLIGGGLSSMELIAHAMEGERLVSGGAHADNVAPCLLGGFTLVRSYRPIDVISITFPGNLWCTVVHPAITVKTSVSRSVIRDIVSISDTIKQTGNAASLVAGLMMKDLKLIGRSVEDVIAEPYRTSFIPGYQEIKEKVITDGALCLNISGSGPSVFAFSESETKAGETGKTICDIFSQNGIDSDMYVSKISEPGTRVLNHAH